MVGRYFDNCYRLIENPIFFHLLFNDCFRHIIDVYCPKISILKKKNTPISACVDTHRQI